MLKKLLEEILSKSNMSYNEEEKEYTFQYKNLSIISRYNLFKYPSYIKKAEFFKTYENERMLINNLDIERIHRNSYITFEYSSFGGHSNTYPSYGNYYKTTLEVYTPRFHEPRIKMLFDYREKLFVPNKFFKQSSGFMNNDCIPYMMIYGGMHRALEPAIINKECFGKNTVRFSLSKEFTKQMKGKRYFFFYSPKGSEESTINQNYLEIYMINNEVFEEERDKYRKEENIWRQPKYRATPWTKK